MTLNSPTSYYLGAQGAQGFDYRLASAFAQQLGVKLSIRPVANAEALRTALRAGNADLAAAQLGTDAHWQGAALATDSYLEVPQLVVQGRNKTAPRDITSLHAGRIVVRADSPQLDLLQHLKTDAAPTLSWTVLQPEETDALKMVNDGTADYTIVDANEFEFEQHIYPEISIAFALPDPRAVRWMVRPDARDLLDEANHFIAGAKTSGTLARITTEAVAESSDFNYEDARRFQSDIEARLPQLQSLFEQASRATGLDWRLIAAVGYQESKWQMEAASDSAQGIMMLTSDAADTVGVDRADLRQNIMGGAQYLAQVIDTIPKRIQEPDRTWLALAAYNVGYGHLEDARVLAQMRGKNPDSWDDVREQLPLLSQEQWYSRVKRGYARGWEPAKFVEQVRQYLSVLEWFDTTQLARAAQLNPIRSESLVPTAVRGYD